MRDQGMTDLKDEIFVGNADPKAWPKDYLRHLKTLRLGDQAVDLAGKKLPTDYALPMLLCRSELPEYNRIMEQRMKKR